LTSALATVDGERMPAQAESYKNATIPLRICASFPRRAWLRSRD
jgi:hypothetical protein